MISTVIIILVIIIFVILGYSRGAAKTLLHFAAVFAAAAISNFLSSAIAQSVYDAFIRPGVLDRLQAEIERTGAEFTAKNSLQALPGGMNGILRLFGGMFGVSPEAIQGRMMLSSGQTERTASALEQPVGELCVFMLSVIIALVLFILLMIVFKLIIRLIIPLFSVPVIRTVNRFFGAVLGLLEGAVFVLFMCNVLYVLLSCISPATADNPALFGDLFNALVVFK